MLSYGDMLDALASHETKNIEHSEKNTTPTEKKKEKVEEVIETKGDEEKNENKSNL